jgi:CheY-like chemotaxis protein
VRIGFKGGIAFVIVANQIPKLLGLHVARGGFFEEIMAIVRHLPETSLPTVTLALGIPPDPGGTGAGSRISKTGNQGRIPLEEEGVMGTKDILVVDDCAMQLRLLSDLLRSQGFNVTAVTDGFKALEVLTTGRFRMMINDFLGMNRIELAALVRRRHRGTPVVLVTASRLTEIIDEAVSGDLHDLSPVARLQQAAWLPSGPGNGVTEPLHLFLIAPCRLVKRPHHRSSG